MSPPLGDDAQATPYPPPLLRFVLLGLALAMAGCGGSGEKPVRIVLITIDTLRGDGLTEQLMPHTWAFAGQGQLFDQFYSSTSTTQPTHASLLTGLHPWQHGVTRNGMVLADGYETIAERLQGAGYSTHAIVASYPLKEIFGYAQGFDEFQAEFQEPYYREWEGQELEDPRFYSLGESVTDSALAALDGASSPKQFFWFHYFDPHDPYGDAARDEGKRVIAIHELLILAKRHDPEALRLLQVAKVRYESDVQAMDRALGRLFARLEEDADEWETHVLFTSDHGESFGERGRMGHGKALSREQVHVPFFVVSPRAESARREDEAGSIDIPRTILGLAGVPAASFGGRDLLGDKAGRAFGMRRDFAKPKLERLIDGTVLTVVGARFFAVRDGVLYSGDGEQVFVEDDPAREASDEMAAPLRTLFATFAARLSGTQAEELLDPEVQAALQAIGYTR